MTGINTLTIPLAETHRLSMAVVHLLERETIGSAIAACGLTIARLCNPTARLTEEQEIKFVQELMEWAGSYWELENVKES